MNEVQQNWRVLEDAFVQEILNAKKRFIVGALQKIMPPDLFALAKASKDQAQCVEWAKREGYRWMELKGETLLMRNNVIIGRFRPTIVGEKENKHCEFLAFVLGEQISVRDPNPMRN